MPRTGCADPEWFDSGSNLRALAMLVNRTLAVSGRGPALAFANLPSSSVDHLATAVTPPRPAANNPGGGTRMAGPTGVIAPGPDFLDKGHAETWRLVALAQNGDGEAFGQLYDRYVDTVFRFIYFRVNDRALAEDFTSETFLRALRRITTISYQGRDIGAWFVTIARNIVFDHMKSARHRLEITTADTLEGGTAAASPESAVIDALTSDRLMSAVRQLGDEQRECVMLRFIQGYSVSETADVMGKNEGAIKALQHRAVRKLAELVGAELR